MKPGPAASRQAQAPLRCWLLTDGAPGHESQSRGIADAIARFRPLKIETVPLRVRRRWLKSAGRVLLRLEGTGWLLESAHDITLPPGMPDLVVSSGGNTLLANALIARRYGVPNFYSGTPKGFDTAWYSCVFTVTAQGGASNVVLPLPPVPGELCAALAAAGDASLAPLALLIGGDGAVQYSAADWLALAAQTNAISARTGRRWLITTSRRTGAVVEDVLAREVAASAIAEAVWWSRAPRKVMRDFLARAAAVYVTGDSMTMVAEAIYAGRPVHVVMPALSPVQGRDDPQDAQALAGYVQAGFVRVAPIAHMARAEPLFAGPPVPDVQALIWNSVRELLS